MMFVIRAFLRILLLLAAAMNAYAMEAEWRSKIEAFEYNPWQVMEGAEQALRQAQANANKSSQAQALRTLAFAHAMLKDAPTNLDEQARGVAIAREAGDMDALCWLLLLKQGEALGGERSNTEVAPLDEAAAIAERHGLNTCLAWTFLRKGESFLASDRKPDAMQSLSKSHDLFESQGNRQGMAMALGGMAGAYAGAAANMEDLAKAGDYYQRALRVIDPLVHRRIAWEYSLNLGKIDHRRNDMVNAKAWFERSLALAREAKFSEFVAIAEYYLGALAKDEQRLSEALRHFDTALSLTPKFTNKKYAIKAFVGRAEVLAQQGRKKESLDALSNVETVRSQLRDFEMDTFYFVHGAEIFARFGDFQKAFELMDLQRSAFYRLVDETNARLTDRLKVNFGVQLKEADNALLRAQQKEARTRRLALVLALALSLLLFGGIAFYLRKRAAAARAEADHHKALADAFATANRAKSTFLANMSHELRSPLNAMLGFSRLLIRDPRFFREGREDLSIVLRSGEHLYALINQVLDLSKIEAGSTTLAESDFDLYALLDELADMFAIEAKQKRVGLIVDSDPAMPRYVRADAVKLRQVLINLLSNAFKFTASGSVTLQVAKGAIGKQFNNQQACALSFAVIDTGPGIAADELSKLGDAFVQAQAGRQAKEGAGLGLAISRSFVQLMGGELKLSSQLNQGTTVAFSIPVRIVEMGSVLAGPEKIRSVVALAPGQPRYRILAVDDREEGRQLLTRLLAPLGFDVREAADGKEAIDIREGWDPHLIFMDMRMPVMGGREATRRIKESPRGKETIVIALTASSFEEEREEILAVGCDDFMRKPFREDALFEMLQKHLGVDFIYEEAVEEAASNAPNAAALTKLPAELPAELKVQLVEALKRLDIAAVETAIDAIRRDDAALADELSRLAKRFQYGQLLTLLAERDDK